MTDQDELIRTAARAKIQTVNPATGEPGLAYDEHNDRRSPRSRGQGRMRRSSHGGGQASPSASAVIRKAGAILRERSDEFARLMTEEMGKTFDDGRAEVEKCAFQCDWFADNAERYLAREPVDIGGPEAFVTFNPLGVVLAVMPWNFPFWQVFRFAAPALMAGNGALLKHASNVPGCALAIEEVLHQAGVPSDLFRTLLLPSSEVKALIEDDNVAAVTLTGSVAAGRSVATAAGGVLKKCVLELGGSDAYVDPRGRRHRSGGEDRGDRAHGQRRAELHRRQALHRRAQDPRAVRERAHQCNARLTRWAIRGGRAQSSGRCRASRRATKSTARCTESVRKGARLVLGGDVPDRPGAWYPATVLTNVHAGQPAHDEEVFGPVAAIIAAEDERDAIRIANASEFGLGSGVLTGDLDRGRRIAAEELDAGMSFVNENVRSDPRMPFGGVKHSGYGRECSEFGIREFVNIKSVHVKPLETTAAAGSSDQPSMITLVPILVRP